MIPEIPALIPHAGAMCLLERVIRWDDHGVLCATASHRRADHPLRSKGRLSALHLVEYGAQAAAVHGGLVAWSRGSRAAPGMIAALRECRWQVDFLDSLAGELMIDAERLVGGDDGWVYRFEALSAGRSIGRGRVVIMPRPATG